MKRPILILSVLVFIFIIALAGCKKDDGDTTPPVIALTGNNPMQIFKGTNYTEPGATAIDDVDGNISDKIVITNNIDINTIGNYEVKYNVKDKAGNAAVEVIRVVDVITL
ncbi:DUF5011 domain-containing protein [Bacteroidota bacterium]